MPLYLITRVQERNLKQEKKRKTKNKMFFVETNPTLKGKKIIRMSYAKIKFIFLFKLKNK